MIYKSVKQVAKEMGVHDDYVRDTINKLASTKSAVRVFQEGPKTRILINTNDLEKYYDNKSIK